MPKKETLTKTDINNALASATGLKKSQVDDLWVKYYSIVQSEIKKGHDVVIPGIGKIAIKRKAATHARPGRNPATGETITIKAKPARNVIKIRAAKSIKDLV